MISYHLVTSFVISYSVIASSRAYLVTLVAHILLNPKAICEMEAKERNSKKRKAFKQEQKEKESQASKQEREFMQTNTCAKDTWKGKPTLACI